MSAVEGERWRIKVCPDCRQTRDVGGCLCSEEPVPRPVWVEVVLVSAIAKALETVDGRTPADDAALGRALDLLDPYPEPRSQEGDPLCWACGLPKRSGG
jgi:hypothetical protein